MKIKKIDFTQLEKYNKIEMKKTFNQYRTYISPSEYTFIVVEETTYDWTNTEKMNLWREILNQDATAIYVIEEDGTWVAGCVVVTHSPKVNMLQGDMNNAVLWDIRVQSDRQGKGYGSLLLNQAITYAREMNTKQMLIETQNNNPKAIDFYIKNNAHIYQINRKHYKDLPKEDQLIMRVLL